MRGKRAKILRVMAQYDLKLDRHPNHEKSRQYGYGRRHNMECVGARALYQYLKARYKARRGWLRTV